MKPTEENMTILQNLKTAKKSSKDRWIGGVCGGLGAATQVPSWVWRAVLLFSALAFGVGLLLYVVLWICMPGGTTESEPGAAPNSGRATPLGSSGAAKGPPS